MLGNINNAIAGSRQPAAGSPYAICGLHALRYIVEFKYRQSMVQPADQGRALCARSAAHHAYVFTGC